MDDLSGLPAVPAYSTGFELRGPIGDFFPETDPQIAPYGSRVLVQLRRVPTKSFGGIVLPQSALDSEAWNVQVAKLVRVGPLAFKRRESGDPWPEGVWAKEGDFVRVPKYGGDRWSVNQDEGAPVAFLILNDHELIGKIEGDPLKVRAYVE